MKSTTHLLLAVVVSLFASFTHSAIICNETSQCPESAPCCSQYGECGVGAYCLGGCDPRFSFNLNACMAMPVCKNSTTSFNNHSLLTKYETFLGDANDADWVYSGYLIDYEDDDALIMAMPPNSGGTVISSTRYMWYGKVSVQMKSSHLRGVVTAFILFSNAKDEIDYEFVGADLETVQTNYYYQGVLNFTNSVNISLSNTFTDYHTYELEWTEDQVTWLVDGQVSRVLKKVDTWNEANQTFYYPQTPARVQFSLWPAGNAGNPVGTVNWAGGQIDWNAPDLTSPGYYYAILKSATIECYAPPAGVKAEGAMAYAFNNSQARQGDVMITNDRTDLESLERTGLDPGESIEDKKNSTSSSSDSSSSRSRSSSSSKSGSTSTSEGLAAVPTGNGVGNVQGAESATSILGAGAPTEMLTGFIQNSQETLILKGAAHGSAVEISNHWLFVSVGFLVSVILL